MLDKNNLAQLKQLKQQLLEQKEYATGVVKGTQRRFGFVVVSDGREIFLAPEEMQKVFPGDTVKVLLKTDNKGKVSGTVEKVKDTALIEFNGRYVVKGQGHFVEPDMPRFNRWIFVPGSARKEAKPGDYVHCKISRHAYPHAKPQAKIINVIGDDKTVGIEADYMISKFQLDQPWPENWQQSICDVQSNGRQDLRDVPFITIDAQETADLDDAVYAQCTDEGWQLQVAIADPTARITPDSPLEKAIAQRGTSVYLPGIHLPMLPAELANDQCSLLPARERPALVCTVDINHDGTISCYTVVEATIQSHGQLSYEGVANFLDNEIDEKPTIDQSPTVQNSGTADNNQCAHHSQTLKTLSQLSLALREQRKRDHLVIEGRADYQFILNGKRKLERIDLQTKNRAHLLIEECMVAVNRCAADSLGENGVFVSHPGFRSERLPDVCKLAQEQLAMTDLDATTPEGYRQLMATIDDNTLEFPLRSVLSRLLERSQLSHQPKPHYGMGLSAYTTFTSPIRKYSDFLVHKQIKAKLKAGSTSSPLHQNQLDAVQRALDNARQARYQMEQWLKCQFIETLVGQRLAGHVSQINSNGFTVRLDGNFIEGFVETKPLAEKYSFDPMRLRLSSKSQTIELDQAIEVVVKAVDCRERSIHFTLPCEAEGKKRPSPQPNSQQKH